MISSGLFDSGIADSTKSYHQSRVGRYGPSSEGGPSFADLPALGVGGGPAADVEYADYGEYGMDMFPIPTTKTIITIGLAVWALYPHEPHCQFGASLAYAT